MNTPAGSEAEWTDEEDVDKENSEEDDDRAIPRPEVVYPPELSPYNLGVNITRSLFFCTDCGEGLGSKESTVSRHPKKHGSSEQVSISSRLFDDA